MYKEGKIMNNKFVTIKTIDADSMVLTQYHGKKKIDRALMSDMKNCTHEDLLATIEQFRLHGLNDEKTD